MRRGAPGVPGKYGDAALAGITRSQTVTKAHRGQTQVRESFSAVAAGGQVHLPLAYRQGGMVIWATAESRTCRCMPPATRAWCAGTKKTTTIGPHIVASSARTRGSVPRPRAA